MVVADFTQGGNDLQEFLAGNTNPRFTYLRDGPCHFSIDGKSLPESGMLSPAFFYYRNPNPVSTGDADYYFAGIPPQAYKIEEVTASPMATGAG